MKHSIKLKLETTDQFQRLEYRFDRSKFNVYNNSTYRNAKQRELMMLESQEKANTNYQNRL